MNEPTTAPGGESPSEDGNSEFLRDLAQAAEKRAVDRERFMKIMGLDLSTFPIVDHGVTSGHPLSRREALTFDMVDGGVAWLDKLIQSRTYAGVLLGVPDDPVESIITATRQVKRLFSFYQGVRCVLPPRLHRGKRRVVKDGAETFRDWQLLPGVTTYALLTSSELARSDSSSSVVVIWFQDDFGGPSLGLSTGIESVGHRDAKFPSGC